MVGTVPTRLLIDHLRVRGGPPPLLPNLVLSRNPFFLQTTSGLSAEYFPSIIEAHQICRVNQICSASSTGHNRTFQAMGETRRLAETGEKAASSPRPSVGGLAKMIVRAAELLSNTKILQPTIEKENDLTHNKSGGAIGLP